MYLNPIDPVTGDRRGSFDGRVDRWMRANGCRDYVALEPIIVRGNIAEYQAICRRERLNAKPGAGGITKTDYGWGVKTRTKRLRIRIPFSAIA